MNTFRNEMEKHLKEGIDKLTKLHREFISEKEEVELEKECKMTPAWELDSKFNIYMRQRAIRENYTYAFKEGYQAGRQECVIKVKDEALKEAIELLRIQKNCIDHLLGKKESFGDHSTIGFGVRVENFLNELENPQTKEIGDNVVFWTCDKDKEYLTHESMDEAIDEALDEFEEIEDFPETLTVYGFARAIVNKEKLKKIVLEASHDFLAENYDGEDGHEANEEIESACDLFIQTYIDNYTPWQCRLVKEEIINVKEWIAKEQYPMGNENEEN